MIGVTPGGIGLLLLAVAAAAGVSAGLIVLLRPLLVLYAMARPNFRSSHSRPTPQGGGLAVVLATLCISAIAFVVSGQAPSLAGLASIFGAVIGLAIVGAIDDVRALPAGLRIVLHAVAVGIVIASLPADLRAIPFLPVWAERTLLLLAGIWIVNLVNFMHGIDWMTVAEFAPALR